MNETTASATGDLPDGARVTKPGYGYRGTLLRYEVGRHRIRHACVAWDGRVGYTHEDPRSIVALDQA